MKVPTHIDVMGEPKRVYGDSNYKDERFLERERLVAEMSVPERLMVAGGEAHLGRAAQPKEVLLDQFPDVVKNYQGDLADLPEQLTLAQHEFPDVIEPACREESMSQASIAIEENPLQELKLMRRQLGRLSTRLYQLEDETERRKSREFIHWAVTLFGIAGVILINLLRK